MPGQGSLSVSITAVRPGPEQSGRKRMDGSGSQTVIHITGDARMSVFI